MRGDWWQDRVGWGNQARAGKQRWLTDTTSVNDYADLDGSHVWTILTTSERPELVCGLVHPERGGSCVMPPDHFEAPHVWAWGPSCYVVSLRRSAPPLTQKETLA